MRKKTINWYMYSIEQFFLCQHIHTPYPYIQYDTRNQPRRRNTKSECWCQNTQYNEYPFDIILDILSLDRNKLHQNIQRYESHKSYDISQIQSPYHHTQYSQSRSQYHDLFSDFHYLHSIQVWWCFKSIYISIVYKFIVRYRLSIIWVGMHTVSSMMQPSQSHHEAHS